jgi:hypothetical protein
LWIPTGRMEIVIKYFDKGSKIRFHELKRISAKSPGLDKVEVRDPLCLAYLTGNMIDR